MSTRPVRVDTSTIRTELENYFQDRIRVLQGTITGAGSTPNPPLTAEEAFRITTKLSALEGARRDLANVLRRIERQATEHDQRRAAAFGAIKAGRRQDGVPGDPDEIDEPELYAPGTPEEDGPGLLDDEPYFPTDTQWRESPGRLPWAFIGAYAVRRVHPDALIEVTYTRAPTVIYETTVGEAAKWNWEKGKPWSIDQWRYTGRRKQA